MAKTKFSEFIKIAHGIKFRISSPFGERIHPVTKVKRFHNGVDIPLPVGTPIHCPKNGTVEIAAWHDAGGNQLRILHYDGTRTGYSHLDKTLVEAGQKVTKGQLIALSGNTGKSTGPHLHFTYRPKDTLSVANPLTKFEVG